MRLLRGLALVLVLFVIMGRAATVAAQVTDPAATETAVPTNTTDPCADQQCVTDTATPTIDPCAPVQGESQAADCLPSETPTATEIVETFPTVDPCLQTGESDAGEVQVCDTETPGPTETEAISPTVRPTFETTIGDAVTVLAWTPTTQASAVDAAESTEVTDPKSTEVVASHMTPVATSLTVTTLPNAGSGSASGSTPFWLLPLLLAIAAMVILRCRRLVR
jgi:hypothetical protein